MTVKKISPVREGWRGATGSLGGLRVAAGFSLRRGLRRLKPAATIREPEV
jgi:hypothetical protein